MALSESSINLLLNSTLNPSIPVPLHITPEIRQTAESLNKFYWDGIRRMQSAAIEQPRVSEFWLRCPSVAFRDMLIERYHVGFRVRADSKMASTRKHSARCLEMFAHSTEPTASLDHCWEHCEVVSDVHHYVVFELIPLPW